MEIQVLRGTSFSIHQGEIVSIVGPSGSGKSTLLGLIGGLDTPTEGKVEIDGLDISRLNERELTRIRSKKIGFVFQFFSLIPTLTAIENVALPLYFSPKNAFKKDPKPEIRASELLTHLGLENRLNHHPPELSGGQQQRVAIARSLANNPPLLLADEPTGNLNTEAGALVIDKLRRTRDDFGTTIIIVTHDNGVAMQVEDTLDYRIASGQDIASLEQDRTNSRKTLLEPDVYSNVIDYFNLKPGDTLTLRFPRGAKRQAIISGITQRQESGFLAISNFRNTSGIVPEKFIHPGEDRIPSVYALNIEEKYLSETMNELSTTDGLFIITTEQLSSFTTRILDKFASLPLIVLELTLFASSVIIANTVSLAALERRQQIGVMKAIGLQSEHVLSILLVENGVLGLTGGILGVGIGIYLVLATNLLVGNYNLPTSILLGMVGISTTITLAVTLVTAFGASREKPLNVLRYE